jgi:putative transposase
MGKRRSDEQIRKVLRDADRDLANGLTVADVCRKHNITQATYYCWRKVYDPTVTDDARQVRELTRECERLKQLVAELMLERQMLQEVAKKKW